MQERKPRKVNPPAPKLELNLPSVKIPPTDDILKKLDAALKEKAVKEPGYCECGGCAGRHEIAADRQVAGKWYCNGCAIEREKGRKTL